MGDGKELDVNLFGESGNLLDPDFGEKFIAEHGEDVISFIEKNIEDAVKDVKAEGRASMAESFREHITEIEEELKSADLADGVRKFLERVVAYWRSVVSRLTEGEAEQQIKEKV